MIAHRQEATAATLSEVDVPDYRLFCLDEKNRIQHREDFEADDDVAAVAHARERYPTTGYEIWELGRLVARIPLHGVPSSESPDPQQRAR
jgi:hypothetical protein